MRILQQSYLRATCPTKYRMSTTIIIGIMDLRIIDIAMDFETQQKFI